MTARRRADELTTDDTIVAPDGRQYEVADLYQEMRGPLWVMVLELEDSQGRIHHHVTNVDSLFTVAD